MKYNWKLLNESFFDDIEDDIIDTLDAIKTSIHKVTNEIDNITSILGALSSVIGDTTYFKYCKPFKLVKSKNKDEYQKLVYIADTFRKTTAENFLTYIYKKSEWKRFKDIIYYDIIGGKFCILFHLSVPYLIWTKYMPILYDSTKSFDEIKPIIKQYAVTRANYNEYYDEFVKYHKRLNEIDKCILPYLQANNLLISAYISPDNGIMIIKEAEILPETKQPILELTDNKLWLNVNDSYMVRFLFKYTITFTGDIFYDY